MRLLLFINEFIGRLGLLKSLDIFFYLPAGLFAAGIQKINGVY